MKDLHTMKPKECIRCDDYHHLPTMYQENRIKFYQKRFKENSSYAILSQHLDFKTKNISMMIFFFLILIFEKTSNSFDCIQTTVFTNKVVTSNVNSHETSHEKYHKLTNVPASSSASANDVSKRNVHFTPLKDPLWSELNSFSQTTKLISICAELQKSCIYQDFIYYTLSI